MTDAVVQIGISNLLLSGAVAALAFTVHRHGRYPALAHALWVLALVKAVTPPLLTVPMSFLPSTVTSVGSASATGVVGSGLSPYAGGVVAWLGTQGLTLFLAAWLIGSAVMLIVSVRRIRRFSRLLADASSPAPAGIQHLADVVAFELGMRSTPTVHISAARLAPMTWWTGGRVRVILPAALRDEVDAAQLRWILAHELAHIKRRDHLVRWLEWFASVAFWWNPVVWWSRRNLRLAEEDACDALVLEHLQGAPKSYARTLLAVVEVMAAPGAGTPALATGIDAARSLEHRLTRIISTSGAVRAPRYVAVGLTSAAMLLMTVGISAASKAPELVEAPARPVVAAVDGAGATEVTPEVHATLAPASESFTTVRGTVPAGIRRSVAGTLSGTSKADTITGTGADETINGHAGADRLGGGPGRDTIRGGDGGDTIRGGDGADTVNGGSGRDTLGGGAGADTINGGSGNDVIQGGAGRDTVDAGAGDDIVRVWADGTPDQVDCGSGNDRAVIGSTDTAEHCETVIIRDR